MKGTLHEDQCTSLIVSRLFILRTRNTPHKICSENQNTHFGFSNIFSFENHAVNEKMCKKYCRAGQTTDDNMAQAQTFCIGKCKAVPLKAQRVPGSFPDFMITAQVVVGCQPYAPAAFISRKCSWYSFLLETESTPGP